MFNYRSFLLSSLFLITTVAPNIKAQELSWHWQHPLPRGGIFYSVWGSSGNNVFAVGYQGVMLQYDGNIWMESDSGTSNSLNCVWGASKNDIFAVGDEGTIIYSDGIQWSVIPTSTSANLESVWGSSENDVFAVGWQGVILHFDGKDWSAMESGTTETLRAIWGISKDYVIAVGDGGTVLLYDGLEWKNLESGTTSNLSGVWGHSEHNVYITSSNGIFNFDGSSIEPAPTWSGDGCVSIDGFSNDQIYVIDGWDDIYKYDGKIWSKSHTGPEAGLNDLWYDSGGEVIAVGNRGIIIHFDGEQWSCPTIALPKFLTFSASRFAAISGTSESDIFAVGLGGEVAHYDGKNWTEVEQEFGNNTLLDVVAISPSKVVIVGVLAAFYYDGDNWNRFDNLPAGSILRKVWAAPDSDIFAVGDNGCILHFDGEKWTKMDSGTSKDIRYIWGTSANNVYAGGTGADSCVHYDGNQWSSWAIPSHLVNVGIDGVWGFSENEIYIASGGSVYRNDGVDWLEVFDKSPAIVSFRDLWGNSKGELFGISTYQIIKFDGTSWSEIAFPKASYPHDLWTPSSDNFFTVGSGGDILRYGPKIRVVGSKSPNVDYFNQEYTIDLFADEGVVEYRVNGNNWMAYSDPLLFSNAGDYYLETRSIIDGQQVYTATPISFSIDKNPPTPPNLISSEPPENRWSDDNTADISWTASEDEKSGLAGYSYLWDKVPDTEPDKTVETAETAITSSPLPDGTNHYFHVCAVDMAGNISQTLHIGPYHINTIPRPTDVGLSDDDDTGISATDNITRHTSDLTIEGSSVVGGTVQIYDNGNLIPETSGVSGPFSIDLSLFDGTHAITARYTNELNGTSLDSDPLNIIVDTQSPSVSITNPADGSYQEQLISIIGTASDSLAGLSDIKLEITDGTRYVNAANQLVETPTWVTASGTENWEFNTSQVLWWENTKYTVTARATDKAGNSSVASAIFYIGKHAEPSSVDCRLSKESVRLGELFQIDGTITPAPEQDSGAFVSIKLMSPDGSSVYRTVLANVYGEFSYRSICGDTPIAGEWRIQTSWSGNDQLLSDESEPRTLNVVKADARVTLDITSQAIKMDEHLSISGKFTPEPHCGGDLSGIPITLTISDPDGLETTGTVETETPWGHFLLENYAGFSVLGDWTIQASFGGNEAYNATVSDFERLRVVETAGYAIVVQGKIASEEGLASHTKTTEFVYDTLISRGFLDDDILYLNYDADQAHVDKTPSESSIEEAIVQWASAKMNEKPANLYIVMVDHGLEDHFFVEPETITANQMSNWLDELQNLLTGQASQQEIVIILGFCRSGSFIDDLSGPHRIVVASASPDESSYKGPLDDDGIREGEFFISEFFKAVSFGKPLKRCFEEAVRLTEIFTGSEAQSPNAPFFDKSLQHPMIDDNGDQKGSNDLSEAGADGIASQNIIIGVSSLTQNDPGDVRITEVAETLFLTENEDSANLWAKVNENTRLRSIWVEIKPPNYVPVNTGGREQLEMSLKRIMTSDYNVFQERYEWKSLQGFDKPGTYQVFYFSKDDITENVSPLMETRLYKAKADNRLPAGFSLVAPATGKTLSPTFFGEEDGYLIILDWGDASDPDGDRISYTVTLSLDEKFEGELLKKENLNASNCLFFLPEDWTDNDEVFWKVQAIDKFGAIRECFETWRFRTLNDNPLTGCVELHVLNSISEKYIHHAYISIEKEEEGCASDGRFLSIMATPPSSYNATIRANGYKSLSEEIPYVGGKIRKHYIYLEPSQNYGLSDVIKVLQTLSGLSVDAKSVVTDIDGDGVIGLKEAIHILGFIQ